MVAVGHEGPGLLDARRLFQGDFAPGQFVPEVRVELRRVGEVGPPALRSVVHHVSCEDLAGFGGKTLKTVALTGMGWNGATTNACERMGIERAFDSML